MLKAEEVFLDELPLGSVFASGSELCRKIGDGLGVSLVDGGLVFNAGRFRVNGVQQRVRARVFVITGVGDVQSR